MSSSDIIKSSYSMFYIRSTCTCNGGSTTPTLMINLFDPSTVELPLYVVERARLTQHVLGHRLTRNSRDQNKKKDKTKQTSHFPIFLLASSSVCGYAANRTEEKKTRICVDGCQYLCKSDRIALTTMLRGNIIHDAHHGSFMLRPPIGIDDVLSHC